MRKFLFSTIQILIIACVSMSMYAQDDTPHVSADGRFAIEPMPDYPFVENFDPTDEQHQMMIASYPFDIDVDLSIIDDTTTMLFSTHDSDDIEVGQIIISVVTNENWKPFDTVDEMLDYWYASETAEQFRRIDFHGWKGAELDISQVDRTGIYDVVMLDDGMYALTIIVTPKPQISVDGLQGIADTFNTSISYIPAEITPLDDLDTVSIDNSILASPIPSPDGRYSFRAPKNWDVRINRNGTVTLSTPDIAENDLPEFALEFEVQPLSPDVRQPEAYILEKAETLGAPLADDDANPARELNLNERRIATFGDYADFTGLTVVMLLDDETLLIMNGISSIDDPDGLAAFAFAVSDSITITTSE